MSHTPSSEEIFPIIGMGGTIQAIPENKKFLELVESTQALSPIELHTLATSYHNVLSNSGLGNLLGFIALDAILKHPVVQHHMSAQTQPLNTGCNPMQQVLCTFGFKDTGCDCPKPKVQSSREVKRVSLNARLDVLVEVTLVEGHKRYVVLDLTPTSIS